jgi:hypothetical protein
MLSQETRGSENNSNNNNNNNNNNLKGETDTDSEIIASQDQALQTKGHTTKYYKQKRDANAYCVNNLTRQWNTT